MISWGSLQGYGLNPFNYWISALSSFGTLLELLWEDLFHSFLVSRSTFYTSLFLARRSVPQEQEVNFIHFAIFLLRRML